MDYASRSIHRINPSHHRRSRRIQPPENPSKCVKYILFFLNVVFWLVGALILCIGAYLMTELRDIINGFKDLWFQPAILITVVGAVLFIITFFGCIGSLRENICLLAFYGGCVAVILLILVAAGVTGYLLRGPLEEAIDDKLRKAIVFYRDEKKQDLHFLIDTTQTEMECCGSRQYTDWQLNQYFNCSSPALERCGVPFSCCKKELQMNRQCGYIDKLSRVKRSESINTEGCLDKGIFWIQSNFYIIAAACGSLLFLILLTTCMAFSFRKQIKEVQAYNKNVKKRSSYHQRTH